MPNICVSSPFPTYSSIRSSINGLFINPFDGSSSFSIPEMPTLPDPIFPSISSPNLQLAMFNNELMTFQMLSMIDYVYDVISSIFSLPFPEMPGLGIDLPDLLSVHPSNFVQMVKDKYAQIGDWSFLPMVPDPIFPSTSIPDFESLLAFQTASSAYLSDLVNMLYDMVNGVADKFKLPGMPSLPKFPTKDEILSMVSFRSLDGIEGISIPGFSFSLSMPRPLIPNMSYPEYEFMEGYKTLLTSLSMENFKKITDFITDTLHIGLSLPEVCSPVIV